MKPTVVLVGRPNVGKSTLFNRLTRSRAALVADFPGLTRDRHYGHGRSGDKPFLVVDTGGFEPVAREGILAEMARQTRQAIDEADVVILLVDGRQGLHPQDRSIAAELRRSGRRTLLAVNKAEGLAPEQAAAEFHELALGEPLPISAAHGDHVAQLLGRALEPFPAERAEPEGDRHPRIAVVGRPNVGKSTLVNALLGEERVIVFDQPGTTRDSIEVEFERGGRRYTLVDTAGVRRRGKVFEAVEKFSVVKTLQAVEEANVVLLVLDARQEISEQDAHIAGFILEAGRALVVAVNKWDGLEEEQRDRVRRDLARKLAFLGFARAHFVSALSGLGLGGLLPSVEAAYQAARSKLPTPRLTRVLKEAVARQAPPRAGFSRPKLRYAHQGGMNPPIIVIHGNALENVPESYRRYLEGRFRDAFGLQGTPLRIEFRTGRNPYAERRR
jgi:GTP-binding protein